MHESTYKTVKVTLIVQIKAINKQREHSLYSLGLVFTDKNLAFVGFYCKKACFGEVRVFINANNQFTESFYDRVILCYLESLYEVKRPQNLKANLGL